MGHSTRAKESFLAALQQDPTVMLACEAAGVGRATVYRWRKQSKPFAVAWDDAVERCHDVARSSIYKRGILGWDEQVVSMGQAVYEVEQVTDEQTGEPKQDSKGRPLVRQGKPLLIHKWSDTLAMGYAKANLPEYKEKPQVNINAQLADLAEQAKNELLADLAASITHEGQE